MYQITWKKGVDETSMFTESWPEVRELIEFAERNADNWWVSMVADSSDAEYALRPTDHTHMAYWFDCMSKLMPPQMSNVEIVATIFNLVDGYWDREQKIEGFQVMTAMAESLPTADEEEYVH